MEWALIDVQDWVVEYGYWGLFFGAFLAATIIPFSSDILMMGLLAIGGDPVVAVIVATIGNWLGGLTSYGLGWLGKWQWIERWLRVSRDKLERQQSTVEKWGSLLALLTWLPFIGDMMAIALGFYKIDLKKVAFFMLIGKGARFVMWAVIFWYSRDLITALL